MFGLLNTGFAKKDLQTIKSEIETDFKNVFGVDIDVSESSNFGQIIGLLSKKVANLWDLSEAVYSSQNPDSAEGTQLDRVAALVGVTRLPALGTTALGKMTGTQATTIPAASIVAKAETGEEFTLGQAVTLDKAGCIEANFEVTTVLDSTLYTITVDSVPYTFTSGVGATAESIVAGLKVDFDAGSTDITFTDNLDGTAILTANDSITEFSFLEDGNMTLGQVARNGSYTASITGALSLPAGTLTDIITPVSGWDSVTNVLAGTTGRDVESDEDFRQRRRTALRAVGAATDEAIQGRLQNLDNVSSAFVISNREITTDPDGRPPKSFESIVQGGTDDDIANEIWLSQPAGIESFGNTTVVVKDSQNNDQTIKFSRPESVYVWIEVDLSLNPEEIFPSNGTEAVKDAIIEFGEDEYQISVDVWRQRLFQPVFSVSGIGSAVIRLATSATPAGPPGAYAEVDIPIDSREIASIAKDRMTVGVV